MIRKYVDILGTKYEIRIGTAEEIRQFKINKNVRGICNDIDKVIYIKSYVCQQDENPSSDINTSIRMKKTLRHEIVHAFLCESGLKESAHKSELPWAVNEEMVDWFAYQGPKIYDAWVKAGCL